MARLAKKYEPADILDELARLYELWAKERGKMSKKYRHRVWKELDIDTTPMGTSGQKSISALYGVSFTFLWSTRASKFLGDHNGQ